MAKNKHLDIRLRVLDRYLRRHKDRYDLDVLTAVGGMMSYRIGILEE
ncbi:MAG TPA: hypothetical protein VK957_06115 [Lunatimonas sp.]|nr:hypothetical protein [Lunatimonas sp.]